MNNNLQTEVVNDLKRRKKAREFLRAIPPSEKIARLVNLQQRYYKMLEVRERNSGRKIPEKWRKCNKARYENV